MTMLKLSASLPVLAVASLAALPALAQDTEPAAASSDTEIIVTGLKRDQAFIDVPVSVQVFNETAIARAGITRPQDFLAQTSNITFIQSNHAGEAFVNVRGQTSVRQSESAVAVVIDGVPLATQNEFNGELFDIQQIEVLKGRRARSTAATPPPARSSSPPSGRAMNWKVASWARSQRRSEADHRQHQRPA